MQAQTPEVSGEKAITMPVTFDVEIQEVKPC